MNVLKSYFLIFCLSAYLVSCSHNEPYEIMMSELNNMLVSNDVESIFVVNKEIAEIHLKPAKIEKYKLKQTYGLIPVEGPQFFVQLGDISIFEDDIRKVQLVLSDDKKIYVQYKSENSLLLDVFWFIFPILIIVVPFIIWLIFLIDILKSEFKNSSDKLIWLLVITFIPIIGLILYLVIGKKQKRKP